MKTSYTFFGFKVLVRSEEEELIKVIDQNFSLFKNNDNSSADLIIDASLDVSLEGKIPNDLVSIKQSINSVSYQENSVRYNDYYGKAITKIDYAENKAEIWASDLNSLHELTYLLIMSRQGKWCDKKGIHKIHAMGIKGENKNLLLMLPMKGGKSTMFARFLSETEFSLISDDSPVINHDGSVSNFNIRFGLENKPMYEPLLSKIDKQYVFSLFREQYGEKTLIDFKAFESRIEEPHLESILIQGVRVNNDKIEIKKINKIRMFNYVFINMTIGVGLPMIIEYFIENSLRDHAGNILIFLKRLKASLMLIARSDCYFALMGKDIQKNFKALEALARK